MAIFPLDIGRIRGFLEEGYVIENGVHLPDLRLFAIVYQEATVPVLRLHGFFGELDRFLEAFFSFKYNESAHRLAKEVVDLVGFAQFRVDLLFDLFDTIEIFLFQVILLLLIQ